MTSLAPPPYIDKLPGVARYARARETLALERLRSKSKAERAHAYALLRKLKISAARESFWEFCRIRTGEFYTPTRPHLKLLCTTLQALYEGKLANEDGEPYHKLMVNIPPRHGKSRTLVLFAAWVLGRNQEERIITCCYNDRLAHRFSKYTRNEILSRSPSPLAINYADIFPGVSIAKGDASNVEWALTGQHFSYYGAGLGAGITGTGCTLSLLDDPVKSAREAYNDDALENIWDWIANTFTSRGEGGRHIEIVNQTRWSEKDPCGRFLASEPGEWHTIALEAANEDGEMLCPEILSREGYEKRKKRISPYIFLANYHQKPIERTGALYGRIKTYSHADVQGLRFERTIAYCDPADKGEDYTCLIVAREHRSALDKTYLYVVDVVYTQKRAEEYEGMLARVLSEHKANLAVIEDNGAGHVIRRNIEGALLRSSPYRGCVFSGRAQRSNKQARIFTYADTVMDRVIMPEDWGVRFPDFYSAICSYKSIGKNTHDDAPDAATGLVEVSLGDIGTGEIGAFFIPGI